MLYAKRNFILSISRKEGKRDQKAHEKIFYFADILSDFFIIFRYQSFNAFILFFTIYIKYVRLLFGQRE